MIPSAPWSAMAAMSRNPSPAKSPISSKTTCQGPQDQPQRRGRFCGRHAGRRADHQRGGRVPDPVPDAGEVVKILREKAATVSVQPVGVRLIVGGRNRKGVFTMTMMAALTATSRRPRPPARVPTSSRVPAPTPTWPPGSRRRSSRRPPTGTAWTMWPIRWTAALPRWPSSTRASTPRISVSL